MRGMVVGEGGRSSGVLLYSWFCMALLCSALQGFTSFSHSEFANAAAATIIYDSMLIAIKGLRADQCGIQSMQSVSSGSLDRLRMSFRGSL